MKTFIKLCAIVALLGTLHGCEDDPVPFGPLKEIRSYNDEHTLLFTDTFEYDGEGRLVREKRTPASAGNFADVNRTYSYDGKRLIKIVEWGDEADFHYDSEGWLVAITSDDLRFDFSYVGDKIRTVDNKGFTLHYDERNNLQAITDPFYAKLFLVEGIHEFDDKRYIYSDVPVVARIYFALCRSEFLTTTSNVFRFNPGPNNILNMRQEGSDSFTLVFKYQYHKNGFPVSLVLEYHSKDQNGNDWINQTDHYEFEYY